MRTTPTLLRAHAAKRIKQGGAAIVEFALIALLFFTVLIGVMEFGRWLFTLNVANETTRLGARLAVVCGNSNSDITFIKTKMTQMAFGIPVGNMVISYNPVGCDVTTCKTVTASLSGATFSTLIPGFGGPYAIPSFPTALPREYMTSAGNPRCS